MCVRERVFGETVCQLEGHERVCVLVRGESVCASERCVCENELGKEGECVRETVCERERERQRVCVRARECGER